MTVYPTEATTPDALRYGELLASTLEHVLRTFGASPR